MPGRLPRPDRHPLRTLLGGALLMVLLGAASGCKVNQATGRSQFKTFSQEEEIAIGEEAMPQLVEEYGGRMNAPGLESYVREVGMKLVDQVEDPNKKALPWEFVVLDSDVINAFALPGGKVFISRALLEQFSSEAEMAGVLGHEVGHVTADHAEQRIAQATTVNVLAGVAGTVAGYGSGTAAVIAQASQVLIGTGGQGFLLKFSRDQESEADTLGIRYMVRAGYDPEGMVKVMEILASAMEGGRQIEILSTHPYPETRLVRIERMLEEDYPGQRGNPALRSGSDTWQQRAAPALPRRTAALPLLPPGADCWCGRSHG